MQARQIFCSFCLTRRLKELSLKCLTDNSLNPSVGSVPRSTFPLYKYSAIKHCNYSNLRYVRERNTRSSLVAIEHSNPSTVVAFYTGVSEKNPGSYGVSWLKLHITKKPWHAPPLCLKQYRRLLAQTPTRLLGATWFKIFHTISLCELLTEISRIALMNLTSE